MILDELERIRTETEIPKTISAVANLIKSIRINKKKGTEASESENQSELSDKPKRKPPADVRRHQKKRRAEST